MSEWNKETRAALEEQAQDDERHALYCDEQHEYPGARYHRERAQVKRAALAEIERLRCVEQNIVAIARDNESKREWRMRCEQAEAKLARLAEAATDAWLENPGWHGRLTVALAVAKGFEPCREGDSGDDPAHNFTCSLLCVVCGLPRAMHSATKERALG